MSKALYTIAAAAVLLSLFACGGGSGTNSAQSESSAAVHYKNECSSCHGRSGNLMMGGAKDLSKSVIPRDEAVAIISGGKGMMPPFKDKFTAQEINELAVYAESLRK